MRNLIPDKTTIVPRYLKAEFEQVGTTRLGELAGEADALFDQSAERETVLAVFTGAGLTGDMASWLFTNVKSKGASLNFVYNDRPDKEAERLRIGHEWQKKMLRRGWIFLGIGLVLTLIAGYLKTESSDVFGVFSFLALGANIVGLGDVADSQGESRWSWCLLGIFCCGAIIPAIYLTVRSPRKPADLV